MTLWLRRSNGLNSESMRQIAEEAAVSWSAESIVYRGRGIGYADGDQADEDAIIDAAQTLLGYRPMPYDPPERNADG
jgi:hypothetical protein